MCVPGASQLPCVVQPQAGPGKQTGETLSPEPCWKQLPPGLSLFELVTAAEIKLPNIYTFYPDSHPIPVKLKA